MTSWNFLPNPGREEEGLGHAGIETFKGSPYPGIAQVHDALMCDLWEVSQGLLSP